jgi:hypothetical protein
MTSLTPDAFDFNHKCCSYLNAGASCACNAPDCTCISDGNFNNQLQVLKPCQQYLTKLHRPSCETLPVSLTRVSRSSSIVYNCATSSCKPVYMCIIDEGSSLMWLIDLSGWN